MKHSQRDTVHRVRAVRSWLEKAEASFDEESDIKGELNLMLAEAEMKNCANTIQSAGTGCGPVPWSRPSAWRWAAGMPSA